MIKIDWQRLIVDYGFLGFYAYQIAEPGEKFKWFWFPESTKPPKKYD